MVTTATIASECVSIDRFPEWAEWNETAWTIQRSIEAAL
jgi:hypothetical protein